MSGTEKECWGEAGCRRIGQTMIGKRREGKLKLIITNKIKKCK